MSSAGWGSDAPTAPVASSPARRVRRLLRSPVALACALVALAGVGLAARRMFASDETKIRWVLEDVVDAFNDGDRDAVLREFNPYRTFESPGSRQLEMSRLLDRAWGAGRDGGGSTVRMELDDTLAVEVIPDDSIPIGLATGQVRLFDRAGDAAQDLSAQRFRAILNPSRRLPPWENAWIIVYVEHVELPEELPPLVR